MDRVEQSGGAAPPSTLLVVARYDRRSGKIALCRHNESTCYFVSTLINWPKGRLVDSKPSSVMRLGELSGMSNV
jgi:hypothetical protein